MADLNSEIVTHSDNPHKSQMWLQIKHRLPMCTGHRSQVTNLCSHSYHTATIISSSILQYEGQRYISVDKHEKLFLHTTHQRAVLLSILLKFKSKRPVPTDNRLFHPFQDYLGSHLYSLPHFKKKLSKENHSHLSLEFLKNIIVKYDLFPRFSIVL